MKVVRKGIKAVSGTAALGTLAVGGTWGSHAHRVANYRGPALKGKAARNMIFPNNRDFAIGAATAATGYGAYKGVKRYRSKRRKRR